MRATDCEGQDRAVEKDVQARAAIGPRAAIGGADRERLAGSQQRIARITYIGRHPRAAGRDPRAARAVIRGPRGP